MLTILSSSVLSLLALEGQRIASPNTRGMGTPPSSRPTLLDGMASTAARLRATDCLPDACPVSTYRE
jgi:hypothetical protein